MTDHTRRRTEFLIDWPVQGFARFRSDASKLGLADVYGRSIVEALADVREDGRRLPFVEAVEDGFGAASNRVEMVPVTPRFLELLRRVAHSAAPSFELVKPSVGCSVPSPDQILAELTKVVGGALSSGIMEMEIE